MVSKLKNSFWV